MPKYTSTKTRSPRTLKELIQIHEGQGHPRNAFPGVVGDIYFYRHNKIYRNIRDLTVKIGFKFEEFPDFSYHVFPILSLRYILEKRTVPLLPNLSFFKDLEKKRRGVLKVGDFDVVKPMANYLLHESAHCIAHNELKTDFQRKRTRPEMRRLLFEVMLGETFAMTTEYLAFQSVAYNNFAIWLAEMLFYQRKKTSSFHRIARLIGRASMFKLCFGLFLYSNFLCRELGLKQRNRLHAFAAISKQTQKGPEFKKFFAELESYTLGMNPYFRLSTTQLYLKYLGFSAPISRLLNFDPLLFLVDQPDLQISIDHLFLATEGRRGV